VPDRALFIGPAGVGAALPPALRARMRPDERDPLWRWRRGGLTLKSSALTLQAGTVTALSVDPATGQQWVSYRAFRPLTAATTTATTAATTLAAAASPSAESRELLETDVIVTTRAQNFLDHFFVLSPSDMLSVASSSSSLASLPPLLRERVWFCAGRHRTGSPFVLPFTAPFPSDGGLLLTAAAELGVRRAQAEAWRAALALPSAAITPIAEAAAAASAAGSPGSGHKLAQELLELASGHARAVAVAAAADAATARAAAAAAVPPAAPPVAGDGDGDGNRGLKRSLSQAALTPKATVSSGADADAGADAHAGAEAAGSAPVSKRTRDVRTVVAVSGDDDDEDTADFDTAGADDSDASETDSSGGGSEDGSDGDDDGGLIIGGGLHARAVTGAGAEGGPEDVLAQLLGSRAKGTGAADSSNGKQQTAAQQQQQPAQAAAAGVGDEEAAAGQHKYFAGANKPLSAALAALHAGCLPVAPGAPLPCREKEFRAIELFLEDAIENDSAKGTLIVSGLPGIGTLHKHVHQLRHSASYSALTFFFNFFFFCCAPSAGKTATVHQVLRSLETRAQAGLIRPFRAIEINGTMCAEPADLFLTLWREMGGRKKLRKARHAEAALDACFRCRMGTDKLPRDPSAEGITVLVVDEIDYLLGAHDQSVVYKLVEWPGWVNARIAVVRHALDGT
jgi:hypothetical protein